MASRTPGLHDLVGGHNTAGCQPPSHGLTDRHDVGHHIEVLAGEEFAGASVAGLDFIEDEQDALLITDLAERLDEAGRWDDVAAFALDRLHEDGGHRTRIADVGEQIVELTQRIVGDLVGGEAGRGLAGRGIGDEIDARHQRVVALAVLGVGGGHRGRGDRPTVE
ncbi:hypothetical protein SDC9_111182 [bioreactor metagenome]|uniref:Uncharacterized protein n=1 Tax=bioreactor metagenome TaxID=1076179 RepID=A0A645BGK3_9ZZZZ